MTLTRYARAAAILMQMVGFLLLPGCGTAPDYSNTQAADRDRKLLSVVMGGNGSCGTAQGRNNSPLAISMYPRFAALRDMVQNSTGMRTEHFVLSCFTLAGKLFLTTSDDTQHITAASPGDVEAQVTALYQREAPAHLLIVGHSYGGWLAMQTAKLLDGSISVGTFATIDAISPVKCSINNLRGCLSAPTDISPAEYAAIGSRAPRWLNFYGTKTPFLHSSAIAMAMENTPLSSEHTDIDNRQDVWDRVQQEVLRPTTVAGEHLASE